MDSNKEIFDKIAKTAFDAFYSVCSGNQNSLLPSSDEWTNFAAIVATFPVSMKKRSTECETQGNVLDSLTRGGSPDAEKPGIRVLCFATGTKCVGVSEMSNSGDTIHDSHAEVLARRGFLKFLFSEMSMSIDDQSDFIQFQPDQVPIFKLNSSVNIHLVTSHTPCGDCTISFVKPEESLLITKRKKSGLELEKESKRSRTGSEGEISDIHRTGAKCVDVDSNPKDSYESGEFYHVLGALRTKPGRGERTLSMSCSDKMMRWNFLGIQGALLSCFMHPIYLSSIILAKCPFDYHSMFRGLVDRVLEKRPSAQRLFGVADLPKIVQVDAVFAHGNYAALTGESQMSKKASPKSVIGIFDIRNVAQYEVIVKGRRQGATRCAKGRKNSRSWLCRFELFKRWQQLLHLIKARRPTSFKLLEEYSDLFHQESYDSLTYGTAKQISREYQAARSMFFSSFPGWTRKPESLKGFVISNEELQQN